MFNYDGEGVSLDGPLLPDGKYVFRITEAEELTSKSGHPMVKVRADVVQDTEYSGWPVFHYVTFLPKDNPGAGIAVHFLKAINEPWEGKIEVKAVDWIGKLFSAQVITDTYKDRKSNKFKQIEAVAVEKDLF